jgi:glycosyltransferase involved in cell wall biosynthesis
LRIAVHDFVGHPFIFELTRQLAADGHHARHFFFKDYPGPKGDSEIRPDDPETFSIEPISINRRYSTGKFVERGLNNLRYGRKAAAAIEAFRPDIVISANTPMEAQGQLIHATHKVGGRFVFWMQDFYSLAVKTLLSARIPVVGPLIGAAYQATERAQLKASDHVVLISEGFRPELAKFNLNQALIDVIPNWGAISELPLRPRNNPWRAANGLTEKFVFLYSGTLGLKHNPPLLLELADAFADDTEVEIVAACAGAGADLLNEALSSRPRSNLRLVPLQPIAAFPDVLGAADVMVGLLESDAGRFSVPSKVLSYLCAGRAILLSAPQQNLAALTVRDADAGLVVSATDAFAFVEAAKSLRHDAAQRAAFAQNGRRYAEDNFGISHVTARFTEVFERVKPVSA